MFWRLLHDTLKWIGISVFPAIGFVVVAAAGVAGAFPNSKPWIETRFSEVLSAMTHPAFWVIFGVVLLTWLSGFLWSAAKLGNLESGNTHIHHYYYAPLGELLSEQHHVIEGKPEKPKVFIQPHDSYHGHSSRPVITKPLGKLYVGYIYVSLAKLDSEHNFEIGVVGFNGNDEPVSIEIVTGHIRGGSGNYRDMAELPPLAIITPIEAAPDEEFVLRLQQQLSPDLAAQILSDIEKKQFTLDLRSLQILGVSLDSERRRGRVPLWDAVTLRRRDDVVPTRVTVMSIQAAASGSLDLGGSAAGGTGAANEPRGGGRDDQ